MKTKSSLFLLGVLAICCWVSLVDDAWSINRRGTYIYAWSKSGASLVGSLNDKLSAACRREEFNQLRPYELIIKFIGDRDRGISGIATTRWNLYDPGRLAAPGMTFHFFNDGYSNCRVYISPQ